MNNKAYISIIGAFLIFVLNFLSPSNLFGQAATFDLRFQTEVDCNQNGFSATLQMKVRNDSFRIGTSSILFNYDATVLAFNDYQSINFDENSTVSIFGSETPVWSPHKFNSTVPGICNLTLLIDIAAASLPAVPTDWIDIGKVNFDVLNLNASPNLTFDIPNTNFNRYDPNDGSAAPGKGDFFNYNELLATQCACTVPTVTNDTLIFDCFQNNTTANLISNDVISTPTFSVSANPLKGTAEINENGQLTYFANDYFCGSDQFTYQVCNDGDEQCCAEATVFITFSDNVDPIFPNPPIDVTVSCEEIPALETVFATDNCSELQMLQDESIIPGDCPNSMIHVRTWTAFDGCGNNTSHTQNITVVDNVPPILTCLDDYLVLCEANTGGVIDSGTPIYSDNCSDTSQITITFVDGELQELTQNKVVGQFTRTWTATDECGNFTTCNQLIQIIDDVAPILFCPSDITVNCGDDISISNVSSAEAFDSCSAVTITFVDNGEMPTECNFEEITIGRTWVAEDACGNKTECLQAITVQGVPCPTPVTREITQYLCEGATVNLKSLMGLDENQDLTVFDENQDLITNTAVYTLPLTGCETGTFEFFFEGYNEAQCLTENSILVIKTIPNPIISSAVATDSCSTRLILECPNQYEVTWNDGINTGEGTAYFATPGESGVVAYTISYIDNNLPDSLALDCLTSYYEIFYDCKANCPPGLQETIEITGCEGDFINLINELQISDGDSIVPSITTINNPQEFELIASTDSCGIYNDEFSVTIYNENGCPVRFVNVALTIVTEVIGSITHEADFCRVRLNLSCPELYTIYWEDHNNEVGFGTEYVGAEGTSGFVTFYVNLLDTTLIGNACGNNTFAADYSCPTNCPDTIQRNESLTVCAETTVNLFERLELADSPNYVVESDEIVDFVLQVGNFFGCETGVRNYTILDYDDNECLIEVINVAITVLPAIYGEILSPSDTGCMVTLGLECPENYTISWQDSEGNTGTGISYIPAQNTAGTVTFTVNYIPNSIILSATELACMQKTFQASFNCMPTCPETIERTESLVACSDTSINILETLGLTDNKIYFFENEEVIDGIYYLNNRFGCGIETENFRISGYDNNQCLIEVIDLSITMLPPFFTNEASTSEDGCEVSLILECSELYTVTWEDDKGRTGEGLNYTAEENTAGFVHFFVEFITDDSLLSQLELPCFSATTEGLYNCTLACPETIERAESFTACAETSVNVFEKLDLGEAIQYVIKNEPNVIFNEDVLDGIYPLIDLPDCEMGVQNLVIEGFDENECLVEIINVAITVIPSIYGEIFFPSDTTCMVELSLECSENYLITWEDSNGNIGEGTIYEVEENTTGTVVFNVEYISETIILSEEELGCMSQSFEANFNCTSACPETIEREESITACANSRVNIFDGIVLTDNIDYLIGDDDIIEGVYQIGNPFGCAIGTKMVDINGYDTNQCLVEIIRVAVEILPTIYADILTSTDSVCSINLSLECADNYVVTWEDTNGNSGNGLNYTVEENTTGVVKFTVEYLTDAIILSELELTCLSQVFEAAYDCPDTSPCLLDNKGIVFDGSDIGSCSLLIEMSDGTILNPIVIPEGVTLEAGQELLFNFIEIADFVSTCQAGINVEIICLENTCPEKGTPCTDGDLATINDAHDGNCNCAGESVPDVESEIDLRFRPTLDCASNAYCVMIQGKAQQKDFSIGTSSIMVNYNTDALEFADYTSAQFDEKETCIGGTSSPWGQHQYDATSVPGKMCLTMLLDAEGVSCPEITTEHWEDIGQICFDIMDNSAMPNILFDTSKTHFNSSAPNDGTAAIKIGELHEIDTEDALACAENDVAVMREIKIKAFLQGAFNGNTGKMSNQLRRKGFIPLTEPYTGLPSFVHFGEGGGETTTVAALSVSGDDAIVDWVFLELRSASDAKTIITTRAGLIQRDGDIVEVDGVSTLQFMVPDERYYIAVKHRNHLGVMTREPVDFSAEESILVDFSDPNMATYGTNAQTKINETMTLWGGNANPDKHIILAGGGLGLPDRDMIFFDIFLSLWFANPDTPITYNSVLQGYYGSDTNLDGKVKYQGPSNDIDAIIFFNVLFHPENTQYRLNFSISEQIP